MKFSGKEGFPSDDFQGRRDFQVKKRQGSSLKALWDNDPNTAIHPSLRNPTQLLPTYLVKRALKRQRKTIRSLTQY